VFQTHRRPGDLLDIEVGRGSERVRGTGALRAIGA
jgi:hypothetical protein